MIRVHTLGSILYSHTDEDTDKDLQLEGKNVTKKKSKHNNVLINQDSDSLS